MARHRAQALHQKTRIWFHLKTRKAVLARLNYYIYIYPSISSTNYQYYNWTWLMYQFTHTVWLLLQQGDQTQDFLEDITYVRLYVWLIAVLILFAGSHPLWSFARATRDAKGAAHELWCLFDSGSEPSCFLKASAFFEDLQGDCAVSL